MKLLLILIFLLIPASSFAMDATSIFALGQEYGKKIAKGSIQYKPGDAEYQCKAYACMNNFCDDETNAHLFKDGCMQGYKDYWGK